MDLGDYVEPSIILFEGCARMGCTKDGSELAKSWQTQIHEHALLRLVLLLDEDASDSSKAMHRHRWEQSVKDPSETPQRLLFIDPDRSI